MQDIKISAEYLRRLVEASYSECGECCNTNCKSDHDSCKLEEARSYAIILLGKQGIKIDMN